MVVAHATVLPLTAAPTMAIDAGGKERLPFIAVSKSRCNLKLPQTTPVSVIVAVGSERRQEDAREGGTPRTESCSRPCSPHGAYRVSLHGPPGSHLPCQGPSVAAARSAGQRKALSVAIASERSG